MSATAEAAASATTALATTGAVALSVKLAGPLAGPYLLILACSVAGSLWPLSAERSMSHADAAGLVLRCTALALLATHAVAQLLHSRAGMPPDDALPLIALVIGAMGNAWRSLFAGLSGAGARLLQALGGGSGGGGASKPAAADPGVPTKPGEGGR